MKIYLTNQKNNLESHLAILKGKSIIKYHKSQLKEKSTTIDLKTKIPIDHLNFQFFFDYNIFPNNILTYLTQWGVEKRKMQVGDTIVQQIYVLPIKIICGVRITEIIDQPNKKEFSYETLEGHVEKGISTFTIEVVGNKTIFEIHTFSTPGNILTKLLAPIFSVPYQTFCTQKALQNVKRQFENI